MKKIKNTLLLLFVAILVGAYFMYKQAETGATIKISDWQVNAILADKFPVEKEYLLLKTTLHQPKVVFNGELDRVEIDVKATVDTPAPLGFKIGNKDIGLGKESSHDAFVRVAGEVDYDLEKGSIFFKNAEILEVEANAPDAPGPAQEKILKAISFVAKQVLNRMPVYQLDEDQAGPKAARKMLEEIKISDGKLAITFKLPE